MRMFPLVIFAVALASPSYAQSVPSGTTSAQGLSSLGGPAVPGVCLLSRQDVFVNSKVGKAAIQRLRTIADDARLELENDRAPIQADVEKYRSEQSKLTDAQRKEREKALSDRAKPIEEKADLRQREVEATRVKVTERLAGELEAAVAQAYKQKGCGLLVDRNSILGGNLTNDLTQSVIGTLDAKLTTITFDRENLAAAPAEPRPTTGSN